MIGEGRICTQYQYPNLIHDSDLSVHEAIEVCSRNRMSASSLWYFRSPCCRNISINNWILNLTSSLRPTDYNGYFKQQDIMYFFTCNSKAIHVNLSGGRFIYNIAEINIHGVFVIEKGHFLFSNGKTIPTFPSRDDTLTTGITYSRFQLISTRNWWPLCALDAVLNR